MVLLGWTEPPQSAEHIREHVPRVSVCPSSLSGQAARPSRSQGPITARPLCLHFVFLFWSVFFQKQQNFKACWAPQSCPELWDTQRSQGNGGLQRGHRGAGGGGEDVTSHSERHSGIK